MSKGSSILYGIILGFLVILTAWTVGATFVSESGADNGLLAAGCVVAIAVMMHGLIFSAASAANAPGDDASGSDK